MQNNQQTLESLDSTLKKYQEKIEKLNERLKANSSQNTPNISSKIEDIKKLFQKAEQGYEQLKNSSEDAWEANKDASLETFEQLKTDFNDLMGNFPPENLADVADEAIEYAQSMLEETLTYVRNNPGTSTMLALIAGFVLGKIIRLR